MVDYLKRLKMKKRLPQALQKLQKGSNTYNHGTAKTAKSPFYSFCSRDGGHILEKTSEIPSPTPAGMGPEYQRIWSQAWTLADWIDDPDGAPLEERRARLPELMMLRDRMAEIENTGGLVLDDPPRLVKPKDTGTWTKWEPASGRDPIIPETCPARCKNIGKCYARAYFKGKPGRAVECEPDKCGRIIQMTSDTTGPGKPEQGKNNNSVAG